MVMLIVGIIAAVIINQLLGALWYSPVLFGNIWAKSQNFDCKEMKASYLHYLGAFSVSLLMVLVMAVLFTQFNITSLKLGLQMSFLIWLGFIVSSHFSGVIWCKKPLLVFFIDIGYLLCSILITAVILVFFMDFSGLKI